MKYQKKLNKEQLKLMKAIDLGDFEETKALVMKGCNPNFWTGNAIAASPLYLAALKGNFDIVSWLVDEGNADIKEDMVPFFSVGMGQIDIGNFVAKRILEKNSP